MSGRSSTPSLVAHHLRSRSAGAAVSALVLVLSLLATAAPIALAALSDTAMRDRLSSLSAFERDVATTTPGFPQFDIPSTDAAPSVEEVWSGFTGEVDAIRAGADAPLPGLMAPARTVSFSRDSPIIETAGTGLITVAFDPAYADDVRLVEGRLPEPAVPSSPDGEGALRSVLEIVLSAETAGQLEWPVGEARTVGFSGIITEIALVGVFEAVDPLGDYWQHVPSVLEPNVFDDGNRPRTVTGTGFAHPASLLAGSSLPARPETIVWYPFDAEKVDASSAGQTAAALRKLTAVSHTVGTTAQGGGILSLRFTADVTATIERAVAQEAATAGVIAMIVAGPIGVAVAVLVLGCRLVLERRRSSLRLLSARGASTAQLRGLLGAEGALLGLVPAVVGATVALVAGAALWGAGATPAMLTAAVLLGLAPAAILVVLAGSASERQDRTDLGRPSSRVRLIAEGVVLALAAAAVVLLFLRGYGAGGFDPLQAATPLLLSLVACLITLRVYPIPLRGVLERARRSDGLSGFLGAARALREPSIGLTPVLALVVGVSVAVSSGVLLSALQTGVAQSAQAQIGADARVTGGSFSAEQLERVRAIEGVAAATGISGAETATLDVNGVKRPTSVFVVDAADLRAVQGDRPGLLPAGPALDADTERMPVVVAAATAAFIDGSEEVRVNAVEADVTGVSRGPSPIGTRENWVALDSAYADEVLGRDPSDRTLLVSLDDAASFDAVQTALRDALGTGIRVESAERIVDDIQSSPLVQGVRIALWAATAVAALLSALAIVMTLTLAAGPRGRMLALLRTLGAPPRAATSLTVWEVGPPVIAAIIAGTIFGALVPLVVLAGVDLRSFTGSTVQPAYSVDAATLALTLGGFLLLAALFTAVALLVSRRARAASVLRTVEEG